MAVSVVSMAWFLTWVTVINVGLASFLSLFLVFADESSFAPQAASSNKSKPINSGADSLCINFIYHSIVEINSC